MKGVDGSMSADQPQDMSVPELRQTAGSLDISEKATKDESVNRTLEAGEERDVLELLKQGMARYEKVKEELTVLAESASRFAPRFHEKREGLERSILEVEGKIAKIDDLTGRLERQREQLHEDLERRQEQMSEIDDQIAFVSQAEKLLS